MGLQVRVTENPLNIGNGFWDIGLVFDIIGETTCHFILNNKRRVNKKTLSVVGSSYFTHHVKVEIINRPA